MEKKMKKLSRLCFFLTAVIFVFDYLCFHFLTDSGFSAVWHPEAGKPFVTELIGILGVLFLFAGILSLLAAKVLFGEKEE